MRYFRSATLFLLLTLIVGLAAGAAEVTLSLTHNGEIPETPDLIRYYIYKEGKRENHEAWGKAGTTARVPDGTYDIVVRFEQGFIVRTKEYKEVEIEGSYTRSVDFQVPTARLTIDVSHGGEFVPASSARISVYRQGERGTPIGRVRPGREMILRPGVYDFEVSYLSDEGLKSSWMLDYPLSSLQRETVSMGAPAATLTVQVTRGGQPVDPERTRWRAYPAGNRERFRSERKSGVKMGLPEGLYDIEVILKQEGKQPVTEWIERVAVRGQIDQTVDFPGDDRLWVRLNNLGGRRDQAWFGLFEPGERKVPRYTGEIDQPLTFEAGNYDIGLFLRDGDFAAERWIENQRIEGEVSLDTSLPFEPAYLKIALDKKQRRRRSRRGTPDVTPRLTILLDRSGSMGLPFEERTWLEIVQEELGDILPDAPRELEIGLRFYGGDSGNESCRAVEKAVETAPFNRGELTNAVRGAQAEGQSPLGFALSRLDEPGDFANSLIVITNNTGSCGGNVCGQAAELLRKGRFGRVSFVALGMSRDRRRLVDCVGDYYDARNPRRLSSILREVIRDAGRPGEGSVAIFEQGASGRLVNSGWLDERIAVPEGRYDVRIDTGDDVYTWRDYSITGNQQDEADRKPQSR